MPTRRALDAARRAASGKPRARAAGWETFRVTRRPAQYYRGRRAAGVRRVANWTWAAWWSAASWSAFWGFRSWESYWRRYERAQYRSPSGFWEPGERTKPRFVADFVRRPPEPDTGPAVVFPVPAPLPAAPIRRQLTARHSESLPVLALSHNPFGGSTMFVISDLAAEMHARTARYTPESMANFGRDLDQWPQTIAHLALALSAFVKRAQDEYPLHNAVTERLGQIYQGLTTAAQAAQEVPAVFRQAHNIDLSRHEQPRRNEHLWNVNR